MISNNTFKNVCPNHIAVFLLNASVSNDTIEAVLGMAGELSSCMRRMILCSSGIQTRRYAIDPDNRRATHTNVEFAAEAAHRLFV